MPGTMSQKILARAAGRVTVRVGEIVTTRADIAMSNDITAPITLNGSTPPAPRVFSGLDLHDRAWAAAPPAVNEVAA